MTNRRAARWQIATEARKGSFGAYAYPVPSRVDLVQIDGSPWLQSPVDLRVRQAPRPDEGLLNAFLRLSDGTDALIAEYASTWGLLGLCGRHDEVGTHENPPCPFVSGESVGTRLESVRGWRSLASRASGLLSVAYGLSEELESGQSEWRLALGRAPLDWELRDRSAKWSTLEVAIDTWLERADLAPQLVRSEQPRGGRAHSLALRFVSSNLFGVLALHLAYAITRADMIEICDGCAEPFVPRKARAPSRGKWCEDDRCLRQANRMAKQKSRTRAIRRTDTRGTGAA